MKQHLAAYEFQKHAVACAVHLMLHVPICGLIICTAGDAFILTLDEEVFDLCKDIS